jgi:isoamylase
MNRRALFPFAVLLLLAGLGGSASALGAQTPLGATLVSGGVQFAIYSQNATRIEVWIFAHPGDASPASRTALTQTDTTNHIWTATASGAGAGTLYGYRVWGPNWTYDPTWTAGSNKGFGSHVDGSGNRFNPNKLLTDPYAKAVTGEPARVADGSGNYHYSTAILGGTDTYAFVDDAAASPKSIVVDDSTFDWTGNVKPNVAMKDEVAYEVHLRGFTKSDTSLATTIRGTYDGFKAKASYFKTLGVTAVELLPIHEYPQYDDGVGGSTVDRINYWGYMTTQFFAPNREYLCPDMTSCTYTAAEQVNAFKGLVKAFHAQGIEVWLDVVYNHTWEGGACGGNPVRYINLRGIDNQSYYTLADDKSCYWDSTGTGNNLNASRTPVRNLILDSLTYWSDKMGVDGFRFDLAYELGREGSDGRVYNGGAQTLLSIASLAATKGVKIVAEAWDTGATGVGTFPNGWSEWNGNWRDNVRQFMKGDNGQVSNLGASITATWSGFGSPQESVNFATAHDGFTLNDLVAYNTKQNGVGTCNPTGADASSGSDTNNSWDSGGDEVLRRRQIRNFATHLMVDHGVPMLIVGDEFRRTQYGNNNGYMADYANCAWVNWQNQVDNAKTYDYFRKLIAFRKAHPGLRRSTAVTGTDHDGDGYKDLAWHGTTPDAPDWSSTSHALAFLMDGSAAETGGSADAPDIYVAYNQYWGNLTFTLPTAPNGKCWWLLADTGDWAEGTGNVYYDPTVSAWNSQPLPKVNGTTYGVQARSSLVLLARPCSATEAVRVDFSVGYSTSPGQDIYLSGSSPELGGWDTSKAVKLNYVNNPTWSGPAFFAASKGTSVQYKYLVRQSNGTFTWEGGSNRSFTVPTSGAGVRNDTWQP